jgi:poly(3-hydroxybutyrate) depolymerase
MMKIRLALILLIILPFIACDKPAVTDPLVDELSSVRDYEDFFLGTFRCGVFVPPSYNETKKYPLVIYLHGHTDTTTWNLNWYNEPLLSSDPCIVLTPKCPEVEEEGWGSSFSPETSPMMAKTYKMIELAEQAFNLDNDRFYIYGTSMGGYGTYGAIRKNPDLFAAAYVYCGAGDPDMAEILKDFPLWIFHGTEDQAVPVHYARDLYNAIKAIGGTHVKYSEYEGVGHNVWEYPRNENRWLLAQRKSSVHGIPDGVVNFSGRIDTDNHISLEWESPDVAKSDNKAWYYNIYRNDEILKEVDSPETHFTDTSAIPGMTYKYSVSVVSYFFRESEPSAGLFLEIP